MKDLIFVREEFGHNVFFNPNTGVNENIKDKNAEDVAVFSVDGIAVIECGEMYGPPMTATDSWRTEQVPVKAGAVSCGFQYKRLISEPEKTVVKLVRNPTSTR